MHRRLLTKGFTLVELVVGIVVLAIAMMIMNTMLISQSKDALEPLYRLRASQLGQSIMQNVLSRSYDEKSDHNGGLYRCGEVWEVLEPPVLVNCTNEVDYGPDTGESSHPFFNDVDDFITNGFVAATDYGNVVGDNLGGDDYAMQYANYAVNIEVSLDNSQGFNMKKITLTIKTPRNEEIQFSALKGNY
jgi:MSHA pilin protein MshD